MNFILREEALHFRVCLMENLFCYGWNKNQEACEKFLFRVDTGFRNGSRNVVTVVIALHV